MSRWSEIRTKGINGKIGQHLRNPQTPPKKNEGCGFMRAEDDFCVTGGKVKLVPFGEIRANPNGVTFQIRILLPRRSA